MNIPHKLVLSSFIACSFLLINTNIVKAQGMGNGYGSGFNSGNSAMGGQYYGAAQAQIDHALFGNNKEMLRNDVDYEGYVLQKRSAFAQQIQQNELSDEKLRTYAEQRLKTLAIKPLSGSQQTEAHGLIDWLKKDAEQRANNLAWLKRQDSVLALLETDQTVSLKNQRNALHNMFEDTINIESQYKWNKQMQLANLHLTQSRQGAVSWGRPPEDGLSNIYGSYGGYGGYGGYSRRRFY